MPIIGQWEAARDFWCEVRTGMDDVLSGRPGGAMPGDGA